MIADIILKIASEEGKKPGWKFKPRPSSAGPERCLRQMVYHGLNQPREPLPGRAIMIFSDSSFHEDLTNDWIRKTSFEFDRGSEQMEVPCRPPMKTGKIDGILRDLLGNGYLYEHKAINHFTFNNYWDNDELPLDNLTQSCIYSDGLQAEYDPDLKGVLLLIKNKNTAQYMEYACRYDRATDMLEVIEKTRSTGEVVKINQKIVNIVGDACHKFDQVLDYISQATLPKRDYWIDHWRCQYCGWYTPCWKGYQKEHDELKTDVLMPSDVADMVRYYKELGAQKNEITKEYDGLRGQVKDLMKSLNAKEGMAGEYLCKLNLINTNRIDKALLSPAEIEKATVKGIQGRLSISKIKGE